MAAQLFQHYAVDVIDSGKGGPLGKLAKAIDFLLAHEEEKPRIGINAQKRVQQDFDRGKSMRVLHRELTSQA